MSGERPNLNNPQRLDRVINSRRGTGSPVQSEFAVGYEAVIKRAVPEPFLKRAAEIVQSRKPKDPRLQDLDVLGMAKVLVVEDDKSWELNHKMIAEEAGHEVVTLQRHFRVLTKFTHVESRLSGHKRQKEVVFDAP